MGLPRSHTKNFTPYPFVECAGNLGMSAAKPVLAFFLASVTASFNSQLDTA